MNYRFLLALCVGGALATGIAGCGGGSNNSLGPGANAGTQVREFNALQGAAAKIDIVRDTGLKALASNPAGGVAYGAATAYATDIAGNGINLDAFLNGTVTGAVAQQSYTLDPHSGGSTSNNGTFTLGVAGVAGQTGTAQPTIFRIIDNYPTNLATNQIALRLVNLSPNAGQVSLFSGTTQLLGLNNIGYGITSPGGNNSNALGSGYQTVTYSMGQTLNLTIQTTAGINLPLASSIALSTQAFTPSAAYTLFLVGEMNPSGSAQPLDLKIVKDYPQP